MSNLNSRQIVTSPACKAHKYDEYGPSQVNPREWNGWQQMLDPAHQGVFNPVYMQIKQLADTENIFMGIHERVKRTSQRSIDGIQVIQHLNPLIGIKYSKDTTHGSNTRSKTKTIDDSVLIIGPDGSCQPSPYKKTMYTQHPYHMNTSTASSTARQYESSDEYNNTNSKSKSKTKGRKSKSKQSKIKSRKSRNGSNTSNSSLTKNEIRKINSVGAKPVLQGMSLQCIRCFVIFENFLSISTAFGVL